LESDALAVMAERNGLSNTVSIQCNFKFGGFVVFRKERHLAVTQTGRGSWRCGAPLKGIS
jgi:hypothetical protein